MPLTEDQKLDEALLQTFPASDAFYIAPSPVVAAAVDEKSAEEDDAD